VATRAIPATFARVLHGSYRLLLRAYPPEFRRRVGADMADVFIDVCAAELRARGPAGLPRLAFRTLRDVARNAWAERLYRRRRPGRGVPRPTPSPAPRGERHVNVVIQDLRFALRTLIKQPAFSLGVIVVLGLGIAGTTGIFSIFNGLFLRPLPFDDPGQLVNLDEAAPQWNLEFVAVSYVDFAAWRDQNETFTAMAVLDSESVNMSLDGEASRVDASMISQGIFAVLGIEPALGRPFTVEEDMPGAEGVVLLGQALWRDRFGADPSVLGRSLSLDSTPHIVIGVLPQDAEFVPGDLWVPLKADVDARSGSYWLDGLGRLRPGVTIERARDDLTRIHRAMIEERPVNEVTSPVVLPILDRILGDYHDGALALLGGVSVVLVIACANVAGLMLARSTARGREVGVRVALGAGRGRIVQQLLTESLVLATAGAVVGAGLGHLASRAALAAAPDDFPRWISFAIDVRFLAFTTAVTVGSALLFGLAPAIKVARTDPQRVLQASGRSTETRAGRYGLNALVVAELALSLVVLVGAGLFMAAFQQLQAVDPGFRTESVLAYRISLPDATYGEDAAQKAFFEEHLAALRALPGVIGAGATTSEPLGGHTGYFFEAEGALPRDDDEPDPVTLVRWTTPGYFEAIGINLLSGRAIEEADGNPEAPAVAIINEEFARHHWGDESPLGRRIRAGDDEEDWMSVVGLVRDARHYGLDREMRPGVYVPFDRSPSGSLTIVTHTAVDPMSLADEARELVRRADPEVPIYATATMVQRLDDSLWARRASSWTFAIFAGVALLLAVSGVYGVISYAVSRRRHEIGIRMALGARRGQVVRHILRHGAALIGAGVVLGLTGSLMLAWTLSSLLFEVSPTEPLVYAGVTVLLGGVALLANLVPARRAASVDPMHALRED
jgi:predicted permease